MRKFVSILCLALIFVSYLFVVSSGNRPIRISFSYPTFRFGRISGTVSGIFKDYYAFVKDVSFIDASIYGCHINGTDGSITFSGNITVNISVISSANNLTLIFNNAIVYLQNTFIYARNLRIVLKNSTILFLDGVSYMHARNFYLYIVESTSRYIGNFRFIGWNSTIIFDHVKNSSMDITNRVSFGIVTYYSGSRLILMNSSINISSYYGAELDIIANSSSVSISNIYDDVKWLDINIDAVSTRITITQSLFNHLSLVRMLDSKLYLDNTVVTGSLNLYSYLDAVELGENVTENGLKVELIGNKDNVSLNDTSNKVIYTYNISTMNIRNAILRKLVMYKVRKVEISDSNIKNLVINNFEDSFIHNSRINKLSLLEGSQVVMNKVYNNQFKARDVFNVSVLDTYMSYVDIYSINNLILRNFYLRSITVDTEHGKWAIIPGMRLALIESLDLYSVWISSKPENDSEGRIHYEYSDALIFQSIINTHMVQFYANISYVEINTYNFYAYEVHFSFDMLLLQGKLDFVSIEKTTFNGQDVIYLEGANDMQIVDKSVIAIASSRLSIANSKFVYVYQSKNITVNSASYIYAYMSQNIFVTNSNIKSGHIFGSANIIVNNTSFSWYFDIENSLNVNLFNVVLNSSFIVVEKSRHISFRNVGFYYSSDMYLPFIRYRTSILLFLTDHIVLEDLYSAGKSEHSTIAVYIYNSRYVTVRNIALGSSSIYIYVGFSYMVSIKNFENFGKYSGVSVVYTDFFLLDAETSESLYFVYLYGAQNFFIENFAIRKIQILYSKGGTVANGRVDDALSLVRSTDMHIVNTDFNGIGFLPYLSREEWKSIHLRSVSYRGMPLVVMFDLENKSISGSYGQLILVGPRRVAISSLRASSIFISNAYDLDIKDSIVSNMVLLDSNSVRVRNNYVLGDAIIKNTSNLYVTDSIFHGEFTLSGTRNALISGNSFYLGKWNYLRIQKSKNVTLMRNKIFLGIVYVDDCRNVSIIGNEFKNNFPVGLVLEDNIMVFVAQNKFVGNGIGGSLEGHWWWYYKVNGQDIPVVGAVWLDNNRFVIFVENDFRNNANVGIIDDSRRVYFVGNNFVDNKHDFYVWDSDCYFSFSDYGNYWSKNDIVDENGDGIDDEAYQFDCGVDLRPLVSPIEVDHYIISGENQILFYFTMLNGIAVAVSASIMRIYKSLVPRKKIVVTIFFGLWVYLIWRGFLYFITQIYILTVSFLILIIMILALLPSLTSNKTYKDTICGVEYMIYLLAPLLLIPSYQSGAIDLLLSLDSWVWILLLIHLFLSIIVLLNESTRLGFSPFLGIIKYVSIILLTILILPFSLIIFDILVFPLLTGLAIGIDLSLSTQRKKALVDREQC